MMQSVSRTLVSGALLVATLSTPALADDQAALLRENPALNVLHSRDPAQADAAISEVQRLLSLQKNRGLFGEVLPQDKEFSDLLGNNPALMEIYRRDRKATAKLLSTFFEDAD